MTCDVLNLEWSSGGRDRETASLICTALRRRGHAVVEESVFRYRAALARRRPRVLYLADPRGAAVNRDAALFARSRGFPIVTVTAEGNFRPERIREMFWGHVGGGELIEDLNLQWSVQARELALGIEPRVAPRLKVAGGVGFDRYRLYEFASKPVLMARLGLRFERLVGYASWTFDRLEREDSGATAFREAYGAEAMGRFAADRDALREGLGRLAAQNPDTLFLLKEHPGVVAPEHAEIAGIDRAENVVVVRDEETVGDCIAASDVWMAFDSTTCLEAWLLGKPTLLFNPTGDDFERDETHRGSPVVRDAAGAQAALDSWYSSGELPGFEELAPTRRELIEQTIQWDDGRNHLRAVHLIESLLSEAPVRPPRLSPVDRARAVVQDALFRGAPGYRRARKRFSGEELATVTRRCADALERFDPEHELTESDLAELERVNSAVR